MGIGPQTMKRIKKLEKAGKLNIKKTKVKKEKRLKKDELVSVFPEVISSPFLFSEYVSNGIPIRDAIKFKDEMADATQKLMKESHLAIADAKHKLSKFVNENIDKWLELSIRIMNLPNERGDFYLNKESLDMLKFMISQVSFLTPKGTTVGV